MNFHLINLGCKVNIAEAEQIANQLTNLGYQASSLDKADFALINTCTVTSKADSTSLYNIKKAARQKNVKSVYVTGCYSELERELHKKVPEIKKIIPQKQKNRAGEIIHEDIIEQSEFSNPEEFFKHHQLYRDSTNSPEGMENNQLQFLSHTRAFLKVQDGCKSFCTFCRIPYARGLPVSRNFSETIAHVGELAKSGMSEIILSGINMGQYKSEGKGLGELLQATLENSQNTLIRLSSVEPMSIQDDFIEALSHPNISPHIHLPMQGGTNRLLSAMKREYTVEKFRTLLEKIYQINPDFAISTDIIVGFPGETDKDVEETRSLLESLGIMKLHVFPYSERPMTVAGKMQDKIPGDVKKERVSRLLETSRKLYKQFLSRLGDRKQRFIVEGKSLSLEKLQKKYPEMPLEEKKRYFEGTSDFYIKGIIATEDGAVRSGQVIPVKIKNNFTAFSDFSIIDEV